jgi:DNA polymerase-1
MSYLIPGYERLVEEERARQAATHRLSCLPWAPSLAAGPIHVVRTAAEAADWAERLHNEAVSLLGGDTEFSSDSPAVVLRNGKTFNDPRSVRPLVCAVAAWCGAGAGGGGDGPLIRLLFDLRRPEVYPGLRELFGLRVPWIAHSAAAELHTLWQCGIEPAEHLLIDTFITACALNLGRFHKREPVTDPEEAVARDRKLEEKRVHITSLVGQCEHYRLGYPFDKLTKDAFRERFLLLGTDDPLDEGMAAYALADAEFALRLHLAQTVDVHRLGLAPHLAAVEWPLVGALARMEWAGMPVNRERMEAYRALARSIADLMGRRLSQWSIKPGSRRSFLKAMHRGGVLANFVRKNKYTTKDTLQRECEQRGVHPAVRPFRLHRYFQRLADGDLLAGRLLGPDGRQRCSLGQLRSASGRIASSAPNLIGLDKRLRPVFEAPAVWSLIEIDYSQKEVGVAGAEWEDAELVRQFNDGDSYAGVAQMFYADQLTPEERALTTPDFAKARPDLRKRVKTLALGILYGRGAASIAEKFQCSLEHAQAELRRFFDCFPQARDNAGAAVRRSLRRGYGLTVTGLRRFVEAGNERFRNALRNHPIQGGAAAIFKAALLRIDGYFRGTPTQLLLPRHDSVLLLTPAGTEKEVIAACKTLMVQAVREKYPQLQPRVDAEVGSCWPAELSLEDYYREECQADQSGKGPGPLSQPEAVAPA